MTDDPRAILTAAGVECAELESVLAFDRKWDVGFDRNECVLSPNDWQLEREYTLAAILALAQLAAKYKWQRDQMTERLLNGEIKHIKCTNLMPQYEAIAIAKAHRWKDEVCTDLDRRWLEHVAESNPQPTPETSADDHA